MSLPLPYKRLLSNKRPPFRGGGGGGGAKSKNYGLLSQPFNSVCIPIKYYVQITFQNYVKCAVSVYIASIIFYMIGHVIGPWNTQRCCI